MNLFTLFHYIIRFAFSIFVVIDLILWVYQSFENPSNFKIYNEIIKQT